jgi:hypothetical protein
MFSSRSPSVKSMGPEAAKPSKWKQLSSLNFYLSIRRLLEKTCCANAYCVRVSSNGQSSRLAWPQLTRRQKVLAHHYSSGRGGVFIMLVMVAVHESRSSVSLVWPATSSPETRVSPIKVQLSPVLNRTSAVATITRMIGRNSLLVNVISGSTVLVT